MTHQLVKVSLVLACSVAIACSQPAPATPPDNGAQAAPKPSTAKYAAKVPASITTPNEVQTRIGALKFFDGLPDDATAQKVFDQLDFSRGIEAFLTGMPAASVYALCEGFKEAGIKPNEGIGIMEELMDARSLFLTPNSTTVYVMMCADLSNDRS